MTNNTRSCGVLLPIFSLPGPYGIGSLGSHTHSFVDFLAESHQRYWQILPLGHTSYGDSPYQAFSSYAGNPYFIDLTQLCQEGLLTQEECAAADLGQDSCCTDYKKLYYNRYPLLRAAHKRRGAPTEQERAFTAENAFWLEDYALFMALKVQHGMEPLCRWSTPLRLRQPEALAAAKQQLVEEVDFWRFVQYHFFAQWRALKSYANQKGVQILGDMPIYVAGDSADVWANPTLFDLDDHGLPQAVAGCPPDGFAPEGQLWGNPLYRWSAHQDTGFAWWLGRLQFACRLYDLLRIDHFRGFESYYSIPATAETAALGHWEKAPGRAFLDAVKTHLPQAAIVAEDLGYLTPEVRELLAYSGYPGMTVLQFAFDASGQSCYLPHLHSKNSVVYTGTHDNTTTAAWAVDMPLEDRAFALEYLGAESPTQLCAATVRAALASVCSTAIIPLQDYLQIGQIGRINQPSTTGGNWQWRVSPEALTPQLAANMRRQAQVYGRG